MKPALLLDTHIALWWFSGDARSVDPTDAHRGYRRTSLAAQGPFRSLARRTSHEGVARIAHRRCPTGNLWRIGPQRLKARKRDVKVGAGGTAHGSLAWNKPNIYAANTLPCRILSACCKPPRWPRCQSGFSNTRWGRSPPGATRLLAQSIFSCTDSEPQGNALMDRYKIH